MTLEEMRKIVDEAPEWAVFWITRNEYHISMLSFPNMTGQQSFLISDLRTELAKHDTLDLEPTDIPHGCIVLEK